ncbi:MAG: beta-galactosidase [Planctomycetaceae bacterium]|nr:beta-galactosidase [Planctomycetaceae bacterium]
MTDFRFRITPGLIPETLLKKAFLAVWGRSPRPTDITIENDILTARTFYRASCTLHVPFPHRQLGVTVIATDSLSCNQESFGLLRELARGSLGRLQKRLFEWEITGFTVPDEIRRKLLATSRMYSKAVVLDQNTPELEQIFLETIETINELEIEISNQHTEQAIAWRTRVEEKMLVFFGAGIKDIHCSTPYELGLYSPSFSDAFHTAMPMPSWNELEPEQGNYQWELLEKRIANISRFDFEIALGPMLTFDLAAFPSWLISGLKEDGFLETHATRFVNALVERFGRQADYWILANRFNSYSIKEIPIVRVAVLVRMLSQQLRSRGLQKPLLIGLDRLWGEYSLQNAPEYEQVQIAEALVSCQEIDGFLLELNFGLDSNSTFPRDPMSINSMLDQWSFLGKRVYVTISVPGGGSDASQAGFQWTDELQRHWTEMLLTLLMGKRSVRGIFWSVLQDDAEGINRSGLIYSSRALKPAFHQFAEVNNTLLK